MIKKDNNSISSVYNETTVIGKIYAGILKVYESWRKLFISGIPPLTLLKCKQANLVDYKVYGESVQDGTPTPDAPIEIESVGDKTSNLFDKEYLSKTENYTINSGGGYFSASIKVKPNTTYTVFSKRTEVTDTPEKGFYCKVALPTDAVGAVSSFAYYIESSDRFATNNKKTVTTGDDGLIYFAVSGNGSQSMLDILFKYYYFQIVEGTTELEYEPYGYKIPVKVRGKNILNLPISTTTHRDVICNIYDNNTLKFEGISTQYPIFAYDALYIPANTTVRMSYNGTNAEKIQFRLVNSVTGEKLIIGTKASQTPTFDVDRFQIALNPNYDYSDTVVSNIQIEIGKTSTDYEPYVEPVTTNIYLDEPLRKTGDYADYVDFENRKVVRLIKKQIFDGTEKWTKSTQADNRYVGYSSKPYATTNTNILCDRLIYSSRREVGTIAISYSTSTGALSGTQLIVGIVAETLDDFKQYLADEYNAGTPMYIVYPLYGEETETIELPKLPLNKGTNIIEVDTTIQPSNMEVTYLGKK